MTTSNPSSNRMCFDLESDAHMPGGFSFADPDVHRTAYRRQQAADGITFRCGVLFDEAHAAFEEYGPNQLDDFISRLASSEALISQNGLAHDLTLLEIICPTPLTKSLRAKLHADLMHIDRGRLPMLAERHIPERWAELTAEAEERRTRANERWPPMELFQGFWQRTPENDLEYYLAKCRLDVEGTYLIFRKIEVEQPGRIKWFDPAT